MICSDKAAYTVMSHCFTTQENNATTIQQVFICKIF